MPKASDSQTLDGNHDDFLESRTKGSERDSIFKSEAAHFPDFQFDDSVARVFSDMLRRSIPGYGALLHMIGVLAASRVEDGTRVYDLGCSLGAVSLSVRHAVGARNVHIIAVDQSIAMVERCREAVELDNGLCPVQVRQGDILDFELAPASLVILNFTIQFVPREQRAEILQKISRALLPGGTLIVSEKTRSNDSVEDTFFRESHDDFRRSNGYSQLEISRKREALERVLVPETPDFYVDQLTRAGLDVIEWFRCLYFVSWIATKPRE